MGIITNIDTLYASVNIENYTSDAKVLLEDLQHRLEQKFINRSRAPEYVTLGGIVFEFVNGKYSWSYGLKCDDFSLYLAHHDNKADFPMYVEFRQEYMWQEGYRMAWKKFLLFIKRCGFEYIASKVSRGDPCCHTDADILQYKYLKYLHHDPRCNITKSGTLPAECDNIIETWGKNEGYTGIRVGKGKPLMARIYDKTEEIKVSKKGWFHTIWKQNKLNTNKVVNIEFEIKREWFREYGIDSVEDLFDRLGEVWYHLTNNYLCFRYHDNDRRSRRTICEWWEDIRLSSFVFGGSILSKRHQLELNIDKAVSGAMGYITSYAAACGYDSLDQKLINEIFGAMTKMADERDINISERIQHKKMRKISPVDLDMLFDETEVENEYRTKAKPARISHW